MPQLLPKWPARIAKAAILIAGVAMLTGFESASRLDMRQIKPLPKSFRLTVVEGNLSPKEAAFRREKNTYLNEAPSPTGANLLSASWFAAYPTEASAVVFEYPATDPAGQTVYRVEYALEEARNRYRLYNLNQQRFVSALDALESAVRRDDATWRERKFYSDLTRIWNNHVKRNGEKPSDQFFIGGIDDLNVLISYSRRLPDGQKIITSEGNVLEVYVR